MTQFLQMFDNKCLSGGLMKSFKCKDKTLAVNSNNGLVLSSLEDHTK